MVLLCAESDVIIMMNAYFERMKDLLGDDFEKYLETVDKEPYRAIRVNTLKITADELLPLLEETGMRAVVNL